jgi:hypothetical protein
MKIHHLLKICTLIIATTAVAPYSVADKHADKPKYGFAGLLSKSNRETLPTLKLESGKSLSEAPIELRSGGYYVLPIKSDGSQELALTGSGFFRAIWINEVVVNDLEIRPYGVESFEFDDEGVLEIKFVAIKPGSYYLKVPGSKGESQRVSITIK